jgi:hypothetical protein
VFKREWYLVAVADLFVVATTVFFLWMLPYVFFVYARGDALEMRCVILVMLILSPLVFWARIYGGDIHIDDAGIGWWAWGRRWRYIQWANVKVVTISTIAAHNQIPPTTTSYSIHTTNNMNFYHSQRYCMRFDDHIPNANGLIQAVDRYVRQYNIAVLDRRRQFEVRRSGLTDDEAGE